jgi:hypothetical protein
MLSEVRAAVGGPVSDLHASMLMVLELAIRLGPVDHAVFCLLDPGRSELQGRFGLGEGVEPVVRRIRVRASPSDSGPLGPTLAAAQDVHMDARSAAPTYLRWLQRFQAEVAVFLGLKVEGSPIGALYFGWRAGAPPIEPQQVEFLLHVRELAVDAILGARRGPAPERTGRG